MTFLSPSLLWFLLAAAIPIAIHLINRRRHKTIPWAAMQFLLKAARQSRGKRKLQNILILTCRTLAIAAVALAAAQPILSGLLGWGRGSIDTVVLLLDRSASMELKPGDGQNSRREIVIKNIQETLARLGGSTRLILIDNATGKPQEIPSPDVLTELSSTAATDTAANIPSLLARAADLLVDVPGRSEIWLASDLQASNWKPEDERWTAARARLASLPRPPALRILSLTGSSAPNSSLSLISSHRSGDQLLLDLEVLRSSEARHSSNLPLSTHINDSSTTETLTLPGQSIRFQKRLQLPKNSQSGYGWLSIPADGNPRDNFAFFAYGPPRPSKILLVSPPGEAADYLALIAAPPGLPNLTLQRADPAQLQASVFPDLAAILWAAPLPTGLTADALRGYISSGGQVVFFPTWGEHPAPTSSPSASFLDLSWSAPTKSPPGKFFILKDWNHTDGPLRDGIDSTPIAAQHLKAILRQSPVGNLTPLARWEDGEPFLARRVLDRGAAYFLGSLPDYLWSNLADADLLLPAVQRIISAGATRFDAPYLTTTKSETSRLLPGETRTRLDTSTSPDPANAEYQSGIFRLGERLLAINRPSAEDQPEILTKETLDSLLENTPHTLFDQAGQTTHPSLAQSIWRTFLIASLLCLISEALLCLPAKALNIKH